MRKKVRGDSVKLPPRHKEDYVTSTYIMEYFRIPCTLKSFLEWANKGLIPAHKIGSKFYFKVSEFDKYVCRPLPTWHVQQYLRRNTKKELLEELKQDLLEELKQD